MNLAHAHILKKQRKLAVFDFDDTTISTTRYTRPVYHRYLWECIRKDRPKLSWEEFLLRIPAMRDKYGSLTQAWQLELNKPHQWCFDIYQDANDDMIKAIPAHVLTDASRAWKMNCLKEKYDFEVVMLTNSPRFFVRPLLELSGMSDTFPDTHLIDIIEMQNNTKRSGLPFLHIRETYGEFDQRHFIDDLESNFSWPRRLGYTCWLMHPEASRAETKVFDHHHPTLHGALDGLMQAA